MVKPVTFPGLLAKMRLHGAQLLGKEQRPTEVAIIDPPRRGTPACWPLGVEGRSELVEHVHQVEPPQLT